jgi:flavorubredoxin
MRPRFQADADLNRHIVSAIKRREPMVDFQTAQEAGLSGLEDLAVLAIAASHGRILVSHDRQTMPQHFAEFIQEQESPGLLIVSQRLPVSAAAEELLLIWFASEADEWTNQISSVPL